MLTLTPKELSALLEKSPQTIDLIDVRGTGEYDEVHIPATRNIPLPVLPLRMKEIDTTKQVIFICRSGGRSGQACSFAEKEGIKSYNLSWGINDFEAEFPTKVVHGEKKKLFGLF
jgi:rhodanese-related sulfurtransferase